jgi:L-amino acid N-acyltransferase YncA
VSATIRLGMLDDASAIARMHVAAWRWAYGEILPGTVLTELDVAEFEARWRGRLVASHDLELFVADDDGEVVGFAAGGSARADDGSGSAEVRAIYLAERAAGRGLGHALLDAVLARLGARNFADVM